MKKFLKLCLVLFCMSTMCFAGDFSIKTQTASVGINSNFVYFFGAPASNKINFTPEFTVKEKLTEIYSGTWMLMEIWDPDIVEADFFFGRNFDLGKQWNLNSTIKYVCMIHTPDLWGMDFSLTNPEYMDRFGVGIKFLQPFSETVSEKSALYWRVGWNDGQDVLKNKFVIHFWKFNFTPFANLYVGLGPFANETALVVQPSVSVSYEDIKGLNLYFQYSNLMTNVTDGRKNEIWVGISYNFQAIKEQIIHNVEQELTR